MTSSHEPGSTADRSLPRREPAWGRVDALDFGRMSRRYHALPPARRGWIWLAAAALVLLLAGIVLRRPLADWIWPETRAQALRAQGAQALARGHLTADDGSGARELYEAAIAIDPDRNEARAGLARVAQTALAQARDALRRDDFERAHRALALARELQVPRVHADALAARLREREADLAGIERLMERAAVARADGRLDGGADTALPLYRRVLSLQPNRIRALEGREDALSDLLQRARAAIEAGEVVEASRMVAAARGYGAGHVDLPQAEGQLARAVDSLRQRAERDSRRGALDRAAAGYARLREIDPGDASARRGTSALADAYALRAERAAGDFDFAAAEQALRRARALEPGSATADRAQRRLDAARKSQARLPTVPGTRRSAARVRALLREASAAEERGDLLTPPGESAYDKLRAARALAPGNAAVRRAQARLAPAARRCFERELPRNDLGRARACLDAWGALEGEGATVRRAQRRLAQRWLDVGDERLGAGEIASASAALRAAEAIDRATPEIAAFRERLRAASASGE